MVLEEDIDSDTLYRILKSKMRKKRFLETLI